MNTNSSMEGKKKNNYSVEKIIRVSLFSRLSINHHFIEMKHLLTAFNMK